MPLQPTTIGEIAQRLQGRCVGDAAVVITGVQSIDAAGQGDLIFVRDAAAFNRARASEASAFLVPSEMGGVDRPQVVVADPMLAMGALLKEIAAKPAPPAGVHASAVVAPDAQIDATASVGPFCVVGAGSRIGARTVLTAHVAVGAGVTIGDDGVWQPQSTVRDGVSIGDRVSVDCGSSIGTDGFTVVVRAEGLYQLPQIGTVIVGDDVWVGAHVTIDRATFDATRIGNGVKIDNHGHIAHNVVVGDHTLLVAYAKIAGSTTIGKHVVVAEDVGITDNIVIGDGCRIGGGSRVFKSLEPGVEVWGHPARPLAEARKIAAIIGRLPELRDEVRALRKKVDGDA
jgi:UDP-3-O-[3-hydroxymyristoyl] glucosamine N-acyltransferase